MPFSGPNSSSTSEDNRDLLTAAAAGNDQAWVALVEQYGNLLLHVTRRHGLTPQESADVVQETWVRFLQHIDTIRDPDRVPGWLATTARRECIARRRRHWRESLTATGECPGVPYDAPDPDDRLTAEQRARELRIAVTRLPARERVLIEALLETEPLTYAEISARLAMPIGSIGPVRARALRRLRDLLSTGEPSDQPLYA